MVVVIVEGKGAVLGRPIVTNGDFATRSSQITLGACYPYINDTAVVDIRLRLTLCNSELTSDLRRFSMASYGKEDAIHKTGST